MMIKAMKLAKNAPKSTTAFSVGAILASNHQIIAQSYSRELSHNSHAEQNCFLKIPNDTILPSHLTLYTTMEPCGKRSVGNTCCADLLISFLNEHSEIERMLVVVGCKEPNDLVEKTIGIKKLEEDERIGLVFMDKFSGKSIFKEFIALTPLLNLDQCLTIAKKYLE